MLNNSSCEPHGTYVSGFTFLLHQDGPKKPLSFFSLLSRGWNSIPGACSDLDLWRHAHTFRDSAYSYKIDYFIVIKNSLNPEGHQNCITSSKVTAILVKGYILPLGGVASGRVCACSMRSRLVVSMSCFLVRIWGWIY